MSLVINANSCRITDSRNLSGAHDFLRTKILKSKICSRANLGSSSISVADKLILPITFDPHDNVFFDTISGYLDTQMSVLSNISDVIERLITLASEDHANQNDTVKLNGESVSSSKSLLFCVTALESGSAYCFFSSIHRS